MSDPIPQGGGSTPLVDTAEHLFWIDSLVANSRELATALVAITLLWVVVRFFNRRKQVRRSMPRVVPWLIDLVLVPPTIIVAGALIRLVLRDSGIEQLDTIVRNGTELVTYLAIAWLVARCVDILLTEDDAMPARRGATMLLRGLMYVAALGVGATAFLAVAGYSITGFLVSTGVTAAVLGFALHNTLADMLSGIALSVEKPMRIDDWLELEDGTVGQVVDITWRSIWLVTLKNTRMVVPNSKLAGQRFEVLSEPTPRYAPIHYVKVSADLAPDYATTLLRNAVLRCPAVLANPPPVVRLVDATTVPYTYLVWVSFAGYIEMFHGRELMFHEIDAALREIGAEPAPPVTEFRSRPSPGAKFTSPTVRDDLRASEVLSELDDDQIERLATHSAHVDVAAGQAILREGEAHDAIYVVVSGGLDASVFAGEQAGEISDRLAPGHAFGPAARLSAEPASITVRAATDCSLIRIHIDGARDVIAESPQAEERLVRHIEQRIDKLKAARAARMPADSRPVSLRDVGKRFGRLFHSRH